MSYYWFNKQELLQKAKDICQKKKKKQKDNIPRIDAIK